MLNAVRRCCVEPISSPGVLMHAVTADFMIQELRKKPAQHQHQTGGTADSDGKFNVPMWRYWQTR